MKDLSNRMPLPHSCLSKHVFGRTVAVRCRDILLSHSWAFSVLYNKYGPPFFDIYMLVSQHQQTRLPLIPSFLLLCRSFSASIQIHAASCKNAKCTRCSPEALYGATVTALQGDSVEEDLLPVWI